MAQGFWKIAAEERDRVAIVEPDGREVTAGAALDAANGISHLFRSLGAERGDRVAVLLPNGAPFVEAYLGATQVGLYFTAINWHLKPSEIAYILENSGAKALIAHERFADVAGQAADEAGLPAAARLSVGEIEGFRPLTEALASQSAEEPADRSAGWIMLYTGGTTGRPKGVRRPLMEMDPDMMGALLTGLAGVFGMEPGPGVHLVTGPLYHSAPMAFGLILTIHLGHTIVLMDGWDPQRTLELIERYRVTSSHFVPTMFNRMLRLPDDARGRYDTSSMQLAIHGAAPCPVAVKQGMIDWWGPVLSEYYAGTEGGGTLVRSEDWLKRPGTVGQPMPGAQVKILSDEGVECASGEVGTVYMTTLVSDFEYHGDPDKTRSAHSDDGFFTLGDVGYLDDEGFLFLCDRKIDMIISGGVNIYPAEVEASLIEHPAVVDCAVIGVPDEEWGESVKAVVELAEAVEPNDALGQELIEHCRERIAHFKCPRSVDFRELPRNEMGKLAKRVLRETYWEGRERAI